MMMTINQKVWCSEQKLTLLLSSKSAKANHNEKEQFNEIGKFYRKMKNAK